MKITILVIAYLATQVPLYGMEDWPVWNQSLRMEICINGRWQWLQGDRDFFLDSTPSVRIPGAHQADDDTAEVCQWYRRVLFLPARMQDSGAYWSLRFEKAGWYTRVLVNDRDIINVRWDQ